MPTLLIPPRSLPRCLPLVIVLALLTLLLGGCKDEQSAENSSTLYGHIDIREVQLAFQDGGQIAQIYVEEGAAVHTGDLLAELDPTRYALAVKQLEAEYAAQQQQVARLHAGSRPQEIAMAEAAVDAAQADLAYATSDLKRKRVLLKTIKISEQEVENAQNKARSAQAALQKATEQLSLAQEGPRKEDIVQAEAALQALEASLALARQKLTDTKLFAPEDGTIQNRILEPGALASAGSPVFTLAMNNPVWARVYISEPELGQVQYGQEATIHTDSYPDKSYQGWVGYISPTAEFTPKTVQTAELRTKLVYRARIFACNDQQELRLGMPVTVTLGSTVIPSPQDHCLDQQ